MSVVPSIKFQENKICIYCKKNMIYGPQTQIMSKTVDNKWVKYEFIKYGWRCPMEDDNCDIVFDEYIKITKKHLKDIIYNKK